MALGKRNRLDELLRQKKALSDSPCSADVYSIYHKYDFEMGIEWLSMLVSTDYARDLERRLIGAKERLFKLELKASKTINGDLGSESTPHVRHGISSLIDRHYERLREQFPDHESHPERDELPEPLRGFEVDFLDEYTLIEHEFRDLASRLRRASTLVRAKIGDADVEAGQRGNVPRPLEARSGLAGKMARRPDKTVSQTLSHSSPDELNEGTVKRKKTKRSTEKGESRAKLISALTKHHDYSNGSALNQDPIGNNELAKNAAVSQSSASRFFKKEFGGHSKYRAVCREIQILVGALKLLNEEFSLAGLYGLAPPSDDYRDDGG